jgi:hypothetical protein
LKWLAMSSMNSLESYVVAPSSDLMASLVDVSFWHSVLMAAGPNNSIQQLHEVSFCQLSRSSLQLIFCMSETRFVPQNSKCCSEALESVG